MTEPAVTHPMQVTPPIVEGVVLSQAFTETPGTCQRHPETGEWWWLPTGASPAAQPTRCPQNHDTPEPAQ